MPLYLGNEGALEVQSPSRGRGKTLDTYDVTDSIYVMYDLRAYFALY